MTRNAASTRPSRTSMSRRQVLAGAGGTGLLAPPPPRQGGGHPGRQARQARTGPATAPRADPPHLGESRRPIRYLVGLARPGGQPAGAHRQRVIAAEAARTPTDQRQHGLDLPRPGRRLRPARPTGTCDRRQRRRRRGPVHRHLPHRAARTAPFRFTSFGDLPREHRLVLSYGQSACAVEAVESFSRCFTC